MSLVRNDDGPGIFDDAVLDEFNIPFGSWIEEAVNWITLNMGGALDVIAWPFEFLLENLVDRFLIAIPWLVVVAIMFVIAWLVRNLTVAMGSADGPHYLWTPRKRILGTNCPNDRVHSRCSDRVHHHWHSSWSVIWPRRLGLAGHASDARCNAGHSLVCLPVALRVLLGSRSSLGNDGHDGVCPPTFDSTDKPWYPPGS